MSDIVKLLPDHVANQIAAGEVIQRPASVAKELLENAIDAGGTNIKLIIRDGGKTLIQVIDNGGGMSPTDARMCWERHATSKINAVEDIFRIRTMGFRGEALASVASVAMVELKTKKQSDQVSTLIRIEGSEVKVQETTASPDGTSITVKNLFYNVPARRNFLKSDIGETRYIIEEFIRIALANPGIAMSMYNNDNETYILKSGDLNLRIEELFRHKSSQHLLEINEPTTIMNVSGYIGKPEFAKKTRGEQFFFVNKRFIKDAYLNHALISCYENLITKEQFPFYALFIDIDPAKIDVNVHPTKTEIKFEDERAVYQIIKAVGKKALGQHYHVPSAGDEGNDLFLNLQRTNPREQTNTSSSNSFASSATRKDWQQLYEVFRQPETIGDLRPDIRKSAEANLQTEGQKEIGFESQAVLNRNLMQVHHHFIICQVKIGILIIDQKAAHERILYERFVNALQNTPILSQKKLLPKSIHLNGADEKLLTELLPEFHNLGFEINSLGKNTFVVSGVPASFGEADEQVFIHEFIEQFKQQSYTDLNKHEGLARLMAKRMRMKAGKKLNPEEMSLLVDELFACREPQYTTDGKTCIKTLGLEELQAMLP